LSENAVTPELHEQGVVSQSVWRPAWTESQNFYSPRYTLSSALVDASNHLKFNQNNLYFELFKTETLSAVIPIMKYVSWGSSACDIVFVHVLCRWEDSATDHLW